jgi:hypothetical protein
MGSGCMALRTLALSGQLHTPAASPPRKSPISYRLGSWVGPMKRYGHCEGEKNLLHLLRLETRTFSR